jgi:hypothetical protein
MDWDADTVCLTSQCVDHGCLFTGTSMSKLVDEQLRAQKKQLFSRLLTSTSVGVAIDLVVVVDVCVNTDGEYC